MWRFAASLCFCHFKLNIFSILTAAKQNDYEKDFIVANGNLWWTFSVIYLFIFEILLTLFTF